MATNIYLKFTSYSPSLTIKGNVTANGYQGAVQATSLSWSSEQTLNIGSQSSGAGAGKVTFNDLHFTKAVDATSPLFFQALCAGIPFEFVDIFFVTSTARRRRAGSSSQRSSPSTAPPASSRAPPRRIRPRTSHSNTAAQSGRSEAPVRAGTVSGTSRTRTRQRSSTDLTVGRFKGPSSNEPDGACGLRQGPARPPVRH